MGITNMRYLFFILFSCLVTQGSQGFALAPNYEAMIIEKVDLVFATPQKDKSVNATSVQKLLKSRPGDFFSQSTLDNDLKTLSKDFVGIDPSIEAVNGRVHITLKLWPKPLIRAINIQGNKKVANSSLKGELGISAKSAFDRQSFNQGFRKLKTYYVKKGFFEAELKYTIDLDKEENEVTIDICIEEGRAGHIDRINFCGFDSCEEVDITELILTKHYNMFLSWLTGQGIYNNEMMQQDEYTILNYLHNQGYSDATVTISVTEATKSNRIIVTITADKGCRYHQGNITFSGNSLYTDEEIQDCICINEGRRYCPERNQTTVRNITNLYGRCGYIDAYVNFNTDLNDDCRVYDIHFNIEEGNQYCVGLIKVIGNCNTSSSVILHETLLVPGELFNIEKLQRTERRLMNIGYFKNVNVYAVESDSCDCLPGDYRDVIIEVEECNTGHFSTFFGMSTAENIFGGINVTERNFNIRGIPFLFSKGLCALRGGGEFLNITSTIGATNRSYVLSWTKPYFLDTKWSIGFDVENSSNRYISNGYEIKSTGFNLHASYLCNAFVRTGVHYRFRNTDIKVSDKEKEKQREKENTAVGEKSKLEEQAENSGVLSAIGLHVGYDSTNHPLMPTCGIRSRFEAEVAGIGGSHTFLSFAYLNSYYYDICGEAILKLRADARFIQPLAGCSGSDIPIEERFFLGGENNIRGYRAYRLGETFAGDEPKGGISMQLLSAELLKPIYPRLDAFLFFDSGHLALAEWDFGRMYSAYGYGIRLQVFEGGPPLIIGMGFPINAKDEDQVKKFFMNVGGTF